MKTTVDLPDALLIEAKKHAAENRTSLRRLIETGLRAVLQGEGTKSARRKKRVAIHWVTVHGGVPPGLDVGNREAMIEWLEGER